MKEKFPSTIWSKLLIGNKDSYLVQNYWRPIFHYIKSRETKEDPEDLTQEFLTQCLAKGFLDRVKIAKEKEIFSFRAYLKISLKNFLANRRQWRNAQKRKGDFEHLSFQEEKALQVSKEQPDKLFDYIWAKELMECSYQELQTILGKDFEIFHAHCLSEQKVSLKEIAKRYQITEGKADYIMEKAQKNLQSIVIRELKKTVLTQEDLYKETILLKEILLGE